MARIRIPIFIPTSAAASKPTTPLGKNTGWIVLVSIFLICSLFLLGAGIGMRGEEPVLPIGETAYSDLDAGTMYEFEEVYVVGEYATWIQETDGKEEETRYYLLYFTDKDDVGCYASLGVSEKSALSALCKLYTEDDTQKFGDLVLDGVYDCKELDAQRDRIVSFYDEAYDTCVAELYGRDTRMHFVYEAEDAATYAEERSNASVGMLIAGVIMWALFATILFFLIRKRKKLKKEEAERQAQYAAYQAGFYGGDPGAYPGGYAPNANGAYPGGYAPNVNGGYSPTPDSGCNGGADGGFRDDNSNTQGQ